MMTFRCNICKAERERDGKIAGNWFSVGVNEYGPQGKRSRNLHIYAWPLGCRSQEDDFVIHFCSAEHLAEFVTKWGKEQS